ncbi:ABC transporter substrate-binding protein [Microlunatus endophyticus]|uniref:ABC transporter substrate-binding protein n=1 Tax=Microlunatus endophyticus TaxID=1716077 RepID=A0A917W226_9ACTN|nr:iron-siderophore ABC transporter substrate-binding protein [Microlunatus endophyticus]GGL53427.1 ABC transporter substrate-binding protein [Microlunatus endophyticus]
MIRRSALVLVAAVLALAGIVSGCTTGPAGGSQSGSSAHPSQGASADPAAFPVTIKHHFGSTTIDKQPTRIVAIGVNDPDNLLALGVIPVGIGKVTWGGNAHGTTPWFDTKLSQLGAQQPAQVDQTDSIPVDEIAKLTPDLILATNSGITKQQYDKLSKIAPVVAFPGDPWTTTWQQSLEMDAKAVGKVAEGKRIEEQTEATLTAAKQRFPQIQGKTFIFAALATTDMSSISYYTPIDARPMFLTSIGMKNAPIITKIAPKRTFYGQISAERAAELKSDVLITYAVKASDAKTFTDDKLIGQIPAIKSGHMFASTDNIPAEAASVPTPLAIPYALDHFVPKIAQAVEGE